MFFHDASHFTVEFPRGPLRIGDDVITEPETVRRGDQTLHVVSPTDAVKDRLLKYAAWDDFSSLRAAVGVAIASSIDAAAVREFMRREGAGPYRTRFAEAVRIFERRVREGLRD